MGVFDQNREMSIRGFLPPLISSNQSTIEERSMLPAALTKTIIGVRGAMEQKVHLRNLKPRRTSSMMLSLGRFVRGAMEQKMRVGRDSFRMLRSDF